MRSCSGSTARHIAVLLCGMRAAPNLGADYGQAFERIYPDLAAKYGVLLYPFFLDGVAANLSLTQPDGLHPNAAGVDVIVGRILPRCANSLPRCRCNFAPKSRPEGCAGAAIPAFC